MILTHHYRLLPTKRQHRAFETILESQRELYNAALEERIGAYCKSGITRTLFDQHQALTEWRQTDAEAEAVPVALQRWTLRAVDNAFRDFFRRSNAGLRAGFPRFRGKGRFATFGFRQLCGFRFEARRIRFKGMPGTLRVHLHRPLPVGTTIKSCTFTRDVKGWKVGFAIETAEAAPRTGGAAVGVDLGISTFAALSDGGFIPSLRAARRAERQLKIAHRALGRRTRGSHGWQEARMKLTRCHAVAARARANHLHQASARLVRDYAVIAVERLNVHGMAQGALAKAIYDVSWGKFISLLRYKAVCAGSRLIEVDPYNTSQECSGCGEKVPKGLSDRKHECPSCGLSMDRDLNAARNVLFRAGVSPGLRNVARAACVQAEASTPQSS